MTVPSKATRRSRDAWIALALLLLVAGVAYGWYIVNGGLYSDDWSLAAEARYPLTGGRWSVIEGLWSRASYRPLQVVYYPVLFWTFGVNGAVHLLWSVVVTTGFAALLLLVLRRVGVPTVHAFAVAALVIVVPLGDAVVLWAAATPVRISGALYLGGLLLTLSMLCRPPSRRVLAGHALGAALYVAAIFIYELVAVMAAASILLYLAVAPARRALIRWAVDAVTIGAAMAWVITHTPKQVHSLDYQIDHAKLIVRQLWTLYSNVGLPSWAPDGVAGPLAIVVVALALVLVAWARRSGTAPPADVRLWLVVTLVAFVYVTAGYVVFAPADFYYSPGAVNFGNRVNGLGVGPLVVMAYGVAMLAFTLALWRWPRWRRTTTALGPAFALALGVAYAGELRDHQRLYVQSHHLQEQALETISRMIVDPQPRTVVLVVGVPPLIAPDLPVFATTWDLQGAVREVYADPTLDAFNAFQGLDCAPEGLLAAGGPQGPYGSTVVLDVPGARMWRIDDRRKCRQVLAELYPPPA